MTAEDVLRTVSAMTHDDWIKIQAGIAEMLAGEISPVDAAEIQEALDEADAELMRGEKLTGVELRQHFGLS